MKSMFLLTVLVSLSFMDFNLAHQKANSAEGLTYAGQLEPAFAIGGETTGIGLRTAQGEFLELKGQTPTVHRDLLTATTLREKIRASGNFISVRGVEIPMRKVFSVSTFGKIE